jgi:glycerol-3-phosphate dehydrogenase
LIDREFDVLVIGGGAFGAAAAWDASLRGLSVALIEQADFGSGASAECFKMVHGGIRYLQHGDIRRLRASCRERSALLRIAPHLVRPLPIAVPTFGRGRKGKALLGAGMIAYDLLTAGKNEGIGDAGRRIPATTFLSRSEVLGLFPELQDPSLTGAAVFADGQMYNAARLVLAFIKSATRRGAVVANYVQATEFLWNRQRVRGVRARDCLDGKQLEIRARLVLNAAGPWAEYLLADPDRFGAHRRGPFSRDAYFIVRRAPRSPYALAVPGRSRDRDSIVSRSARHLFAVPWRDVTLIGVWHRSFADRPDTARVEEGDLQRWLAEMNASLPSLGLRRDEVCYACCGLVPFGSESPGGELSFGKESRFIDHRRTHGVAGLVTLIGIRFTTARGDAATALDLLMQQWHGSAPARAATERIALAGGDVSDFEALRRRALLGKPATLSKRSLEALLCNHGDEFSSVLALAADPAEAGVLGDSSTLVAEVTHAVREEMAVRLEDVVLRRTDLGSAAHPGARALEQAAHRMQSLLGWSDERWRQELDATERQLRWHQAAATVATTTATTIGSDAGDASQAQRSSSAGTSRRLAGVES